MTEQMNTAPTALSADGTAPTALNEQAPQDALRGGIAPASDAFELSADVNLGNSDELAAVLRRVEAVASDDLVLAPNYFAPLLAKLADLADEPRSLLQAAVDAKVAEAATLGRDSSVFRFVDREALSVCHQSGVYTYAQEVSTIEQAVANLRTLAPIKQRMAPHHNARSLRLYQAERTLADLAAADEEGAPPSADYAAAASEFVHTAMGALEASAALARVMGTQIINQQALIRLLLKQGEPLSADLTAQIEEVNEASTAMLRYIYMTTSSDASRMLSDLADGAADEPTEKRKRDDDDDEPPAKRACIDGAPATE